MGSTAKDIDEYIAHAPEVTRPILVKLRRIFQQASPKLEEAIKWNVPCFEYKGPVGGFAAYKAHVSWGLWKTELVNDPNGIIGRGIRKGGKITKVSEIPPASELVRLIEQVMALNEAGIKAPPPPAPKAPADFAEAIRQSAKASEHWAKFTPACQWQYVNWIAQASGPATRARRVHSAVERIIKGTTMKGSRGGRSPEA